MPLCTTNSSHQSQSAPPNSDMMELTPDEMDDGLINETLTTQVNTNSNLAVHYTDVDTMVLQVDGSNNLVAATSPLDNYMHQSDELVNLCYWDYISQVEKVSKASDHRKHRKTSNRVDGNNNDSSDIDEVSDFDSTMDTSDDNATHSGPSDEGVVCGTYICMIINI